MLLVQENTGVLGEDFEIKQTGTDYYIEGIFIKSDTPNGNNRIYPKKYLETGIKRYYDEFINKNKSIGELDHPTPPRTDAKLSERALRVESLEMQPDGTVIGRALVLKGATKGRELMEVIEEQTAFGTSFRAMTQLKNGSDGYVYCGPDVHFRAFDAVLVPSVGEDVSSVRENINNFENVWYGKDGEIMPLEPKLITEAISDFGQKWIYENGELKLDKRIIQFDDIRKAFL